LVLNYEEPIKAIDNYLVTRLTMQRVFEKKGIVVSFVPKISSG
jgi:glutamine synthetase